MGRDKRKIEQMISVQRNQEDYLRRQNELEIEENDYNIEYRKKLAVLKTKNDGLVPINPEFKFQTTKEFIDMQKEGLLKEIEFIERKWLLKKELLLAQNDRIKEKAEESGVEPSERIEYTG